MLHNLTKEMATAIRGVGIAIGECLFGVYGPFLFNRFGQSDPVSAIFGVLSGAAIGYVASATLIHFYRRQPAAQPHATGWLHAHLHG